MKSIRRLVQAVLGLGLTVTLVGCDAAGLLDNLEVTASGPDLMAEATEFAESERVTGLNTSATALSLEVTQTNQACRDLQSFADAILAYKAKRLGTTPHVFCGVEELPQVDAIELDGWSDLTKIEWDVRLVDESVITIVFNDQVGESDVANQGITVNALGLHLASNDGEDYVGGTASSDVTLEYADWDAASNSASYTVKTDADSYFGPLAMYWSRTLFTALQQGFSGVSAGGSVSLKATTPGSDVQDALENATRVAFQLEADAPKFTGKRSN